MNYYDSAVQADGTELVFMLEDPDACYAFDMVGVWRKDNKLYWMADAGCSCPTPFENYDSVEDLNPLTPDTYDEFAEAAQATGDPNVADVLHKVKQELGIFKVDAVKSRQLAERRP